jgi:carbonic anhydrase
LKISGGDLSGDYILEKVTIHWGEHNGLGSDHRLNGLAYPLEMQFFHYSSKYDDSSHASLHTDGLAILSVFFQANPEDNSNLTPIWSKLESIARPGNSTDVGSLTLSNWIPTQYMSFYRYSGSLTVPNCAQSVVWTVFTDPLAISANQLNALRSTVYGSTGSTPLVNNFRATQSLNDREVKRSVQPTTDVSKAPTTMTTASSSLLLFAVVIAIAAAAQAISL